MEALEVYNEHIEIWKEVITKYDLHKKKLKEILDQKKEKRKKEMISLKKKENILQSLTKEIGMIEKGIEIENFLRNYIQESSPFDIYNIKNVDKIIPQIQMIDRGSQSNKSLTLFELKKIYEDLIGQPKEYLDQMDKETIKHLETRQKELKELIDFMTLQNVEDVPQLNSKFQIVQEQLKTSGSNEHFYTKDTSPEKIISEYKNIISLADKYVSILEEENESEASEDENVSDSSIEQEKTYEKGEKNKNCLDNFVREIIPIKGDSENSSENKSMVGENNYFLNEPKTETHKKCNQDFLNKEDCNKKRYSRRTESMDFNSNSKNPLHLRTEYFSNDINLNSFREQSPNTFRKSHGIFNAGSVKNQKLNRGYEKHSESFLGSCNNIFTNNDGTVRNSDEESLFTNNDNSVKSKINSFDSKVLETNNISIKDANALVDCAEKYFNYVCSFLRIKVMITPKIENIFLQQDYFKHELITHEAIKNNLDKLKEYLQLEGQNKGALMDKIKNMESRFDSKNYEKSLKLICESFKEYRLINIQEIRRLKLSIEESAESIKDKHIILLLGNTGSGKTLTIQYLLGLRIKKIYIDGVVHYEADDESINEFFEKNKHLANDNMLRECIKNLRSSHLMCSETSTINPIELDNILPKNLGLYSITICDIPGFQDTHGCEIDIINALLIKNAVQVAKSVRPIINISSKQIDDRANNFRSFVKNIIGLFKNIKRHSKKLNFVFTKFENQTKENVIELFKSLKNQLGEEEFSGFYDVINERIWNGFILNPTDPQNRDLILEQILRTDPIENPEGNFQFFLMEESKKNLIDQINIHIEVIKFCLKSSRFEIIRSKLEDLEFLANLDICEEAMSKFVETKDFLIKYLKDTLKSNSDDFRESLKKYEAIPLGKLEGFLKFSEEFKQLLKMKDYFKDQGLSENSLLDSFESILKETIDNAKDGEDLQEEKIQYLLKHFKNILTKFGCYQDLFKGFNDYLYKKVRDMLESIKYKLKEELKEIKNYDKYKYNKFNIDDFISGILKVESLIGRFREYISFDDCHGPLLGDIKTDFKGLFTKKVEMAINNLRQYLNEPSLNNENRENEMIKSINELFGELKRLYIYEEFFNKQGIEYAFDLTLEKEIVILSDELTSFIDLNSDINSTMNDFSRYQECLVKLDFLRKINQMQTKLETKKRNILDLITRYLNHSSGQIQTLIKSHIKTDLSHIDRGNILKFLKTMDVNFSWIKQYRQDTYMDFFQKIFDDFTNSLNSDVVILEKKSFSINSQKENLNAIINSYRRLKIINDLLKGDEVYKKIMNENILEGINKFENESEDMVKHLNNAIRETKINETSFKLQKLTKYERCLEVLKEILPLPKFPVFEGFEQLKTNLENNLLELFIKWRTITIEYFNKIINKSRNEKIWIQKTESIDDKSESLSIGSENIDSSFNLFVESDSKSEIDELCYLIRQFKNIQNLQEIKNVFHEINEVQSVETFIEEEIYTKCRQIQHKYRDQIISSINNSSKLKIAYKLLEYFRSLDYIFDVCNDELRKAFSITLEELNKRYYEESSKQEKDLTSLLEAKNYYHVKQKLEVLRMNGDDVSRDVVTKIVNSLNTKAKEILKEIYNHEVNLLDKNLADLSKVKLISNYMIDFNDLLVNFNDDIDTNSIEEYDKIKQKFKEDIKQKIQGIRQSFDVERVENFTSAISYYNGVVNLMKRIFMNDLSDIEKEIQEIEHKIIQILIDYKNSDLSKLAQNKSVLLSLKREIQGSEFNQFLNHLSTLLSKVKEKLKISIEGLDKESNSNKQKRNIEEIKSCIEILDSNDRNESESRLKSAINQLQLNYKRIEEDINGYLNTKKYKQLFESLEKIKETDIYNEKRREIFSQIEKQIQEILNKIESFLEKKSLTEAVDLYERECEHLFKYVNRECFCISIKSNLNAEFQKYFEGFDRCFQSFEINLKYLFDKIRRLKANLFEKSINSKKININQEFKQIFLECKQKAESLKNYMISFSKLDCGLDLKNDEEENFCLLPSANETKQSDSDEISLLKKEINNFCDIKFISGKCLGIVVEKLLDMNNYLGNNLHLNDFKIEDVLKSIFSLYIFEDCMKCLIENPDSIINNTQLYYDPKKIIYGINDNFYGRKIIRDFSIMRYFGNYNELKINIPADDKIQEDLKTYFQAIQERTICRIVEYEINGIELPIVSEENFKENFCKVKNSLLAEINDFNNVFMSTEKIKQIQRISKFLFEMKKYENFFPLVDLESDVSDFEEDFRRLYKKKIDEINEIDCNKIDLLSKKLIDIKIISSFSIYKEDYNDQIEQLLTKIRHDFKNNHEEFKELYILLMQNTYGNQIVTQSQTFKEIKMRIFNEKVKTHDLKEVLDKTKILDDDRELEKTKRINTDNILKKKYKLFKSKYDDLLSNYLINKYDLNTLPQKIIQEFDQLKNELVDEGQVKWDNIKNKIPVLLAYLFVLWSMKMSSVDIKSENARKDKTDSIMKPHPGQITTILNMLGITQQDLSNNLSEIKTGEGKSVVLGILSCFFALFDFDVHVACFSKYLSVRDFKIFSNIFESLKIINRIVYGTFNELCEIVINQPFDIREGVKCFLKNSKFNSVYLPANTIYGHVILVDEVDVFFSKEFYGKVYSPCALLRDESISLLLDRIWIEFKDISNLTIEDLKESKEYIDVIGKYPHFVDLINDSIATALYDLKNHENHSYYLSKDGRIGYPEQDNIVYNRNQGYKTLFAYYKEFENGKVSQEKLNEMKFLLIKCGNYSYNKILDSYTYVFGVTGTLEVLNKEEQRIIREEFKIRQKTILPSVYGNCKLKFDTKTDFQVVSQNDFFMRIVDRIKANLFNNGENKRAVLVFFENKKILDEFYNCQYFSEFKLKANILTEHTDKSEKDDIIVHATSSGQVTLLTRMLGRGTDFIIYDNEVINNRGSACIQTFPSESISEEVQIKGRVARQGQDGSYELIVLDTDLEKFSIPSSEFKGTRYEDLCGKREIYSINKFKEENNYIERIKKEHDESLEFKGNLESDKDSQEAICYLEKINFTVKLEDLFFNSSSRTLILMDATGSMNSLIVSCKEMLSGTFDRINEVSMNKNVKRLFEIQLAVYRNYNVSEDLVFQNSEWESNPDNLKNFLNNIYVAGGIDEEAIELGLNHANKEHEIKPVSQVILLGDAPSNSKEQVIERRNLFNKNNWESSKYKDVLCYKEELKKLKDNGVCVHSFYLEDRAKIDFEQISSETGGQSKSINIHSPDKSEFIKSVETIIIKNIAKNSNIDEKVLLKEYDNIFRRSYN